MHRLTSPPSSPPPAALPVTTIGQAGPQAVLDRGFSYTTTLEGKVLTDPAEVAEGTEVVTRLAKGTMHSRKV